MSSKVNDTNTTLISIVEEVFNANYDKCLYF